MEDAERYAHFLTLTEHVDRSIDVISNMDYRKCFDAAYLEQVLINEIGLNNEHLLSQPPEMHAILGRGLHLWQYPTQFSKYMVWLAYNAQYVTRYMEIGCRWGGTFIVVSEWLKKIGAPLELSIAVDPVEPTPFIKRYMEVSSTPVIYLRDLSTSPSFAASHAAAKPDMVFIDGDHSMQGVMNDHALVRKTADIIVHHDISSIACPATTLFWQYLQLAEDQFESVSFTDQYTSVKDPYLGIGALKRK
ncbi:hypothetical protein [Rhizobium sp.]